MHSLRYQAAISPVGRISGGGPPISACGSPLTPKGSYAEGAATAATTVKGCEPHSIHDSSAALQGAIWIEAQSPGSMQSSPAPFCTACIPGL